MSENINHLPIGTPNQANFTWGEQDQPIYEYEESPEVKLHISCDLSDKSEKWLDITLQATVGGSESPAIWEHRVDETAFLHAGKISGHTPIPSGANRNVRRLIEEANARAEYNAGIYMRSLLNGSLSAIKNPATKQEIVEQAVGAARKMYNALEATNNGTGTDS